MLLLLKINNFFSAITRYTLTRVLDSVEQGLIMVSQGVPKTSHGLEALTNLSPQSITRGTESVKWCSGFFFGYLAILRGPHGLLDCQRVFEGYPPRSHTLCLYLSALIKVPVGCYETGLNRCFYSTCILISMFTVK